MKKIIALIGRPNVGKSTLFNRMMRTSSKSFKLPAITEKTPGVTRDRNYGETQWDGRDFIVVDTGGFYGEEVIDDDREIANQVKEQALYAIEEADLIIHLLDAKEGLTPSDIELANILRRSGKKILWVANKIDTPDKDFKKLEFYKIGAEEILSLSAENGYGFDDLMDKIVSILSPTISDLKDSQLEQDLEVLKVAVVGRPNVGKSTLINSLLGKKRLLVSSVPGTTRDSIDTICKYHGKKYLFIDTAGIRKKSKISSLERFSVVRAIKSIERADIVLIVLDASTGIVEQDQRIAGLVDEYGKGAIFLLNKWDTLKDPEIGYKIFERELKNKMWFMDYAPFITISGLQKKRITKIFPLIDEISAERKKRISTPELNRLLTQIKSSKPFPTYKGKDLKFFYMTQIATEPPAFAVFVNYPSAIKEQYIKYIEKSIRNSFSFKGTPIRIYVKPR